MSIHITKNIHYILLVFIFSFSISACAPNVSYRSDNKESQVVNGIKKPPGIEEHDDYDLCFVEFTERGNVFWREQMDNVLTHIDGYAEGRGVTVITYVHGWKHNAAERDENLESFHRLLKIAGEQELAGSRKIIGVYIAWRGLSARLPLLKQLTYWSRKRVAHDVGKGGVTELLLRIEQSLYKNISPTKNVLINTGHSMGATVLLSALNDVLMSRLLDSEKDNGCTKTKSFGHSILLANPAVEANEIFQLKELVKQHKCYADTQDILLHIISSDADDANKLPFKVGQWLGVGARFRGRKLWRTYNDIDERFSFKESDLDKITIANFCAFHTGRIRKRADVQDTSICSDPDSKIKEECFIKYSENDHKCVDEKHLGKHIPVVSNEPLSFVYTDEEFMADHNDIFNFKIAGYLAAITEEAKYKRLLSESKSLTTGKDAIYGECLRGEQFHFSDCFDYFKEIFRRKEMELSGPG